MQVRTQDDAGRWFAPEQLSARQRVTPEGFLLCEAVPIARTGILIYDESEVPLVGGSGGQVLVERNADEVFRPEALASFEGKPVTLTHPEEFVTPVNWKELSVGITQNVRRGEGIESDLVIADLLITVSDAIEEVLSGLRQVSCGYDADYEQLAPGRGRQTNIVGNHVALVKRGRCGSRCAIGDSDEMKTIDSKPQKRSFADRIRAAWMSKDADAAEQLAKEAETVAEQDSKPSVKTDDAATLDALTTLAAAVDLLTKRFDDMEATKTKPLEETRTDVDDTNADEKNTVHTGDSAEMIDLRSRAEILVPGIVFPTRDATATVSDHLCGCQRQVLSKAMQTNDGKVLVEPFLMGRELTKMTGDQVAAAFAGASELAKLANNANGTRTSVSTRDFGNAPPSVADINSNNQKFWDSQRAKS